MVNLSNNLPNFFHAILDLIMPIWQFILFMMAVGVEYSDLIVYMDAVWPVPQPPGDARFDAHEWKAFVSTTRKKHELSSGIMFFTIPYVHLIS